MTDTEAPRTPSPAAEPASAAKAGVQEMTSVECWRLLQTSSVGRLAIHALDGRPDVFPINFVAHDGSIFFRSAPGAKLQSIAGSPDVAFELDGTNARFHWSVVVRGR